ncbi:Response regulator PleD [compost metagenome]
MPEANLEVAREIAERIRHTIATTPVPQVGTLTISIGVASRSIETPTAESVLKRADQQLYHAKESGRNRVAA